MHLAITAGVVRICALFKDASFDACSWSQHEHEQSRLFRKPTVLFGSFDQSQADDLCMHVHCHTWAADALVASSLIVGDSQGIGTSHCKSAARQGCRATGQVIPVPCHLQSSCCVLAAMSRVSELMSVAISAALHLTSTTQATLLCRGGQEGTT